MTRQEAIYELSNIFAFGFYNDRVDEAANMAIEALEQQETLQNLTKPNKSDLISRQAAIDVVRQYCIDNQIEDGDYHANGIEYELNELPTVQPFTSEQIQTMQELESAQVEKAFELGKADRTTGHWIEKEVFDNQDSKVIECYQSARCSYCGKYHTTPYSYFFDNYNFCPNCGADMRGGDTK